MLIQSHNGIQLMITAQDRKWTRATCIAGTGKLLCVVVGNLEKWALVQFLRPINNLSVQWFFLNKDHIKTFYNLEEMRIQFQF
jgi:hypothetical protein